MKASDAPARLHEILARYGDSGDFIGASRQNWYQSGLADALNSWQDGRSRYYRISDLTHLAVWLVKRRGAIELGWKAHDAPLNPEWANYPADAAEAYDNAETQCPQCQRLALRDWEDGRVWCPTHGIMNTAIKE